MKLCFIGLSISSSWGNGHATTYRCLLRALHRRGHSIQFFEKNQTWYRDNRDLVSPEYCDLHFYDGFGDLKIRWAQALCEADVIILGSYVADGIAIGEWLMREASGVTVFYDIDTPVTLEQLERQSCSYTSRELISQFDLYLSFSGGPILEILKSDYHVRRAAPLYCSAEVEENSLIINNPHWDLGYLGTYSSDRQEALDCLLTIPARRLPEQRFIIVGAQYPEQIDWSDNVERLGHLGPHEHRSFYQSQRFTLNVTRSAMKRFGYSPSVRLFEAAARGTPIISDGWLGLDEFFKVGTEILVASKSEEVCAYLTDISESERQTIAQRARRRFLSSHTSDCRAAELEALLQSTRSEAGSSQSQELQEIS